MKHNSLFHIASLFLLLICQVSAQEGHKSKSVKNIVRIITAVSEAKASNMDLKIEAEIQTLDVHTISQLAIVAWTLFEPGDAGSSEYDERWHRLFWQSVNHIKAKETNPEKAAAALSAIKSRLKLDGGESMKLSEMIADLQKRARN